MANRIEITLSDDKLAALDAKRQHEPRAAFIKRAIDAQLGLRALPAAIVDPDPRDHGGTGYDEPRGRTHGPTCKCPVCKATR
jgi:hypothetical protein